MNQYSRSRQNSIVALVLAFLALAAVGLFLFLTSVSHREEKPVRSSAAFR